MRTGVARFIVGSVLLCCLANTGRGNPLDPNSFTSLGVLNLSSGMLTINTDTLQISGSTSFTGVQYDQGSYTQNGVTDFNRYVAVFDFTSVNIGPSVVVSVTGSRPLAILSRGNLTLSSSVNLNGGNVTGSSGGAGGAAGGGAGGAGGSPGLPGVGPGAAGTPGGFYDGGGAGFGGIGGAGLQNSVGGPAYGDVGFLLQGGSGGHGASHFVNPGGGGGGGGALELGAVGLLTVNGNLTANGGQTPLLGIDGGAGAGGGILLHGAGIALGGALSARGGQALGFGGGGGGGRVTASAGSLTASQIQALLATGVNGGGSVYATSGRAGALVIRPDLTVVQNGESLSLTGTTYGQTGPNDPYIELHSGNLQVQAGGLATLASYDGVDYGANLIVDGILNVNGFSLSPSTLTGTGQIQLGSFGSMYLGSFSSGSSGSFTGSITGNGYINNQMGQLTLGGNANIGPGINVYGGVVRVVGPDVFMGGVYVDSSAELRVMSGARLQVGSGPGFMQNYGKISVLGGSGPSGLAELEFPGQVVNYGSGGAIIVRGESNVIFGYALYNIGGALAVSFANANIFGDIQNYSGSQISISGNSNVLFDEDITNDGSFDVATGSTAVFLGSFGGANGISGGGNVHFAGDLRPGHSPASIAFGGNVTFESTARTEIELGGLPAGTQHDKVTIAGHVDLNGKLAVLAINGFIPLPGESFEVLAFGSRSGDVNVLNETGFAGLSFSKTYTATTLSLNAIGLPGDANLDGTVNVLDLVALGNNWLAAGNWLTGDFDGSGFVDQHDLGLMAINWQTSVNGPALGEELANLGLPANVPEPAALLTTSALALLLHRRRA